MFAERVRSVRRLSICALLGASFAAGPALAAPKTKRACAASFEKAQEEQKRGKLLGAERLLISCSARACGEIVQRECTALLEKLEARIPSVVLSVEDESGRALGDVGLTMDGKPLEGALDGRALEVDPGVHTFVLKSAEGRRSAEQIIVMEAARDQRFAFVMPSPPVREEPTRDEDSSAPAKPAEPIAAKSSAAAPSAPAAPSGEDAGGGSVLPYVLGGVGVLGIAGFAVLGSVGSAEESKLPECWPDCSESRVERVRTLYLAADVSLGVGAAALGTGIVLLLTGSSSEREASSAAQKPRSEYALDVRPARGGGAVSVSGSF